MMTLKQVNELKTEGFDKAEKTQLNDALVTVNTNKNFLAGIEKDIKGILRSKMTTGEQLSLFSGSDEFRTEASEKVSYDIDCSEKDFIKLLEDAGIDNIFTEVSIKTKLLNEAFAQGKLPATVASHITKSVQATLKFGKK